MHCTKPKIVVINWYLTLLDSKNQPTTLFFDLLQRHSPLIIVPETRKVSITTNTVYKKYIALERPADTKIRKFRIHISHDDARNERLRLALVSRSNAMATSMMSTIDKNSDLHFVNTVQRLTHAISNEIEIFLTDAEVMRSTLKIYVIKYLRFAQYALLLERQLTERKYLYLTRTKPLT